MTFSLDLERGSNKSEQSSAEGDCPIRVQWDIHSNQSLREQDEADSDRSVYSLYRLQVCISECVLTYFTSNTMRA